MKTLREEIEAIKVANTSMSAKKNALVKLGLRPYEVVNILGSPDVMASTTTNPRFTFGVEIECFVNSGAIRSAAETTGMAYEYEGYNHRDGHNYFKFVTDASVRGMNDAIECVSPVLQGTKGKNTLKNACRTLAHANAKVNRTCGLHVHIGASKLSEKEYANVFNNYFFLEALIDSFMAESRRADNNEYCASIRNYQSLQSCKRISDVQRVLGGRYFKINPMSYNRHKTIEFRQHQGTTNYEKISNWVSFCGKLVNWSKKNRLSAPVSNIDDVAFLSKAEKEFFKARINHFASR